MILFLKTRFENSKKVGRCWRVGRKNLSKKRKSPDFVAGF